MENGTFMKARDSVYDDSDFSNIYTMYDTGKRSKPEKIIKIS